MLLPKHKNFRLQIARWCHSCLQTVLEFVYTECELWNAKLLQEQRCIPSWLALRVWNLLWPRRFQELIEELRKVDLVLRTTRDILISHLCELNMRFTVRLYHIYLILIKSYEMLCMQAMPPEAATLENFSVDHRDISSRRNLAQSND